MAGSSAAGRWPDMCASQQRKEVSVGARRRLRLCALVKRAGREKCEAGSVGSV